MVCAKRAQERIWGFVTAAGSKAVAPNSWRDLCPNGSGCNEKLAKRARERIWVLVTAADSKAVAPESWRELCPNGSGCSERLSKPCAGANLRACYRSRLESRGA